MTTFEIVDRENTPGSQGGVDYGSTPLTVLARSPVAALLWMPGGTYHSGIGQRSYASAYMMVIKGRSLSVWERNKKHDFERKLHEPAKRLSSAMIMERAEKINEFFEADIAVELAKAVKQRKTLLVDGGGEPFKVDARVERKKKEATAAKIAAEAGVVRWIEPIDVAHCRQCGTKLVPALEKHYVDPKVFQPTSLEDVQRQFNHLQVVATEGYFGNDPEEAHLIGAYKTWNGRSYMRGPYFCHNDCAKDYAVRAVETLEALPIIPPLSDEELEAQERAERDAVWGL
ncbi:hypothetical protein HOU03_gp382 [Caulobacter phage CcrSC]|uniref:Uncharacterized protein n=1 Tax=Caulobacter phage CcrSC TaxID=2283272 RepID=A0A385EDY1_9CAUD|nr:hypothetical protein HOU03_gp382 [Caulobacter phage CcrSC]AXQ69886.1 hypothetical protein CcrSC_gp304 [Caulobacter phage CcrSC]